MWKSEHDFCTFVMNNLRQHEVYCHRLESRGTGNGLPDLYIAGHGDDTFVELKNIPDASVHDSKIKIPWRPGQQAWGLIYKNQHVKVTDKTVTIKHSFTVAGLSDGIAIIRHAKLFSNNTITKDSFDVGFIVLPCNLWAEIEARLYKENVR